MQLILYIKLFILAAALTRFRQTLGTRTGLLQRRFSFALLWLSHAKDSNTAVCILLGWKVARSHFASRLEVATPELRSTESIHFLPPQTAQPQTWMMKEKLALAFRGADGTWSLVSKEK